MSNGRVLCGSVPAGYAVVPATLRPITHRLCQLSFVFEYHNMHVEKY